MLFHMPPTHLACRGAVVTSLSLLSAPGGCLLLHRLSPAATPALQATLELPNLHGYEANALSLGVSHRSAVRRGAAECGAWIANTTALSCLPRIKSIEQTVSQPRTRCSLLVKFSIGSQVFWSVP
jgi:hypothetical protein